MTTPMTPTSRTRLHGLAAGLFVCGLAVAVFTNPNAWMQSGFEAALGSDIAQSNIKVAKGTWTPPVAGSEAFWLGGLETSNDRSFIKRTAWHRTVKPGDQFTIGTAGTSRAFEVTSVDPLISQAEARGRSADAVVSHLLVVARTTDSGQPQTLKFLIDAHNGVLPWSEKSKRSAHAL